MSGLSLVSSATLVEHTRQVQSYYDSFESKAGYRLILRDTRHFGYYASRRSFPLFISRALRRMEEQMFNALSLSPGSKVLDAGCGFGHVALFMAKQGLKVTGIDLVPRHVRHARALIASEGREKSISADQGDYHDLSRFESASFNGVYTMETFVHAKDPLKVLEQFFRVIKPGGVLVMHEYTHTPMSEIPDHLCRMNDVIDREVATTGYTQFTFGVVEKLLAEAGFVDIENNDFTDNVMPMMRLFYMLAIVPFTILSFFGMQHLLINMFSGVSFYRGRKYFRYNQFRARKPEVLG